MDRKILFDILKKKIFAVILFESILDVFLVFVAVFFMTIFFPIKMYVPILTAVIIGLISFVIRYRNISLYMVEDRYPHLREILRTCADNIEVDNNVVKVLFTDLKKRLSFVSNFSFLNKRQVVFKVVILCSMAFLIILTSSFKLQIMDIPDKISGFSIFDDDSPQDGIVKKLGKISLQSNVDTDLEESDTVIDILSSGTELSFEEEKEAKDLDFNDLEADSASYVSEKTFYETEFSEDDETTIKNYFDKLNR
ncbi:hypothetical protein K9M79_03180 [Candidatus Woesearchaeota archaeon]|nr:hypothetical protein [Candidatus Woesearchaeota archaeon]